MPPRSAAATLATCLTPLAFAALRAGRHVALPGPGARGLQGHRGSQHLAAACRRPRVRGRVAIIALIQGRGWAGLGRAPPHATGPPRQPSKTPNRLGILRSESRRRLSSTCSSPRTWQPHRAPTAPCRAVRLTPSAHVRGLVSAGCASRCERAFGWEDIQQVAWGVLPRRVATRRQTRGGRRVECPTGWGGAGVQLQPVAHCSDGSRSPSLRMRGAPRMHSPAHAHRLPGPGCARGATAPVLVLSDFCVQGSPRVDHLSIFCNLHLAT